MSVNAIRTGFFVHFQKNPASKKTQGIFIETYPILPKNNLAKISILFIFVTKNFSESHKLGNIFSYTNRR